MKLIKSLFVTLMLLLATLSAYAQQMVTGRVVDEAGEPLPGVSVLITGTTRGTMTDADGYFSFKAGASAKTVKFIFYGMEDAEAEITGQPLHIVMKVAATELEELVFTGYGSAKKVNSLVGSVTTVKSESIKNAPSSSALDMLQGQVAGLAVLTSGGVAGDNSVSMKLHGVGSLTSDSTPLYMIDGVPASARSIMALNPNDIESISILKDASATSIYGSRAANGVVYVITKSGSYNNDATVTVRSQWGISTTSSKALYESMMSSSELASFWNLAGIHSAQYVQETYYDKGFDADTKWYNYLQQFNNPQYQNDIAIEGGGARVSYMIGAGQFHQRGAAIGNVYDRYTVRSNLNARPKDWLKMGINMNFTYDHTVKNPNWSDASTHANYTSGGLSYLTLPFYHAIDPETGKEYEDEYEGGMINHHTYMKNRVTGTDRYGLVGNASVQVDPIRNLTFRSVVGLDGYLSMYKGLMKPDYFIMNGVGWRSRNAVLSYTATITNTAEYSFEIGHDHEISVLLGHEGIMSDYDAFSASADGITDPRIILLDSASDENTSVGEAQSQSKFLSFFGHADYTLMGRYIFDASLRFDESSRFGANFRWAPFWAFGVLWKAKKESFLKNVVWLNDLSLKVSYGTQGNAAIGNYAALGTLGIGGNYAGNSSLYFSHPENPNLTWERQGLLTVNLSTRLLDMFDLELEFYNRKTSSMLMSVPNPSTTGFSYTTQNVGGLLNRGIDVTLGIDLLRGRDYFLKFNTTFNYNHEEVTELFGGLERWEIEGTGIAYVVGKPVLYYDPIYAGVNRDNGHPMWYVPGENIDETTMNETTEVYDEVGLRQNTGIRLNAPIYGGFGFTGSWRNISFIMDFAYVLGKYMINNDGYFYANPNRFTDQNQIKSISDFWTESNRDAKWPDWRQGAQMEFDTHLIEDASFLRLKNLQIAYALPQRWMEKTKVFRDLKVTFTGRNILTLTKYSGIDPEDDTNVSLGLPANSMQFLFGLEFTF